MFEDRTKKETGPIDRRCAYTAGTTRCNHTGSMSHSVRGEGPFYCKFHFRNSDPYSVEAQKEAYHSQRNPDYHKKPNWRETLLEEKQEELGLTKADETDRELAERAIKMLKGMGMKNHNIDKMIDEIADEKSF